MPCPSWSLPAQECKTGSKLRLIEGSSCSKCYALKGNYGFPNVKKARYTNFTNLPSDGKWEVWITAMVETIRLRKISHFRWFDSGDCQSLDHLQAIALVAERTPWVQHWLPTHEKAMVLQYLERNSDFPSNLTVRISAAMVDGRPTVSYKLTSTIHSKGGKVIGFRCLAPSQEGKCKDCRACWSRDIPNVSYELH